MSELTIKSNYHRYEIQYFWELSPKDQKIVASQFDWMDDINEGEFIKYRGWWYSTQDFMSLHNSVYNPNPPKEFSGWDGYLNDSFFSGILIRWYPEDSFNDGFVQMATFYS